MAMQAISVARQSRRKIHTTRTARPEPNSSASMAPMKLRSTKVTVEVTLRISTPGCRASSSATRSATCRATFTSEEPRVRSTSKATTGLPSRRAAVRTSALESVTSAISSSRAVRPPGRMMGRARSAATESAEPRVRIDCSLMPSVPRPPGRLMLAARSCSFTWPAVMPRASSRSGFRATRISRSTPPTRFTMATPGMESRDFATESVTNQDRLAWSIAGAATV